METRDVIAERGRAGRDPVMRLSRCSVVHSALSLFPMPTTTLEWGNGEVRGKLDFF